MTEAAARIAAPLVLVVGLAAGILLGGDAGIDAQGPERVASEGLAAVLDELPEQPQVVVGFDPDLGTYAEVRPTVRVLLADLLSRNARLAFVSLTTEGRALGLAERDRLVRADIEPALVSDLGFLPGAEAGLVVVAGAIAGDDALGAPAEPVDLSDADLVLVIGGNDLGPRSWVEQVVPRIGPIPVIAVIPAILIPETQPYLASEQLAALIATPLEGAAYRTDVDLGDAGLLGEPGGPSSVAIAIGLLLAIAWLAAALLRPLAPSRSSRHEPDQP